MIFYLRVPMEITKVQAQYKRAAGAKAEKEANLLATFYAVVEQCTPNN